MPWVALPTDIERSPYTLLDAQRDLALNTPLTISEAATVVHRLPPQMQANMRPVMEPLRQLFGAGSSVPLQAQALGSLLELARST